MDGRDFDQWAKKLARLRSRRDLLKAGIGAALAGGALAGRGITPFSASAQAGPDPGCSGGDACSSAPACGLGCNCATVTNAGGGVCIGTGFFCALPVGCDTSSECAADSYCVVATSCCAVTGKAGVCAPRCAAANTTAAPTTTTTAAPTTTTTAAPTTTTTAAPTTTTAAPTTTTAAPTTTTTTTTTTTPGPTVRVAPDRGAVGSEVAISVVAYDPGDTVTVLFLGPNVSANFGSMETDANGAASMTRTVPIVPGGEYEVRAFGVPSGEVEETTFTVVPRIVVTPQTVRPGQTVSVALTGFLRTEVVRIRWLVNGTYVQVGTVTVGTNGTGTASVTVPTNAPNGPTSVRGDGTELAAQTSAVTVSAPPPPVTPTASLSPARGTVNGTVTYTLANFPANATVSVTWRRTSGSLIDLGTVQTNGSGASTGTLVVPATPGGPGQQVRFASGSVSAVATYEVVARIKVGTGSVGQPVDVSLRGFGKQESVRIRWLVNGSYVQVGLVTTSNTGSANVMVTIPNGAQPGNNTVRGDGPAFRAQTNVAQVVGPPATTTTAAPATTTTPGPVG